MNTITRENMAYKALGEAVAAQAVEDYKRALKDIWALEKAMNLAKRTLVECERFFDSEYGKMMSDMDGDYIKKHATETAKWEFDHKEIVTAHVKIKLREECKKKKNK